MEEKKSFGEDMEFSTVDGVPLKPKMLSVCTSTSGLTSQQLARSDSVESTAACWSHDRLTFLALLLSSSILMGYVYLLCHLQTDATAKFQEALLDMKNNIMSGQCGTMQITDYQYSNTNLNSTALSEQRRNSHELSTNKSKDVTEQPEHIRAAYYSRGIILVVVVMSLTVISGIIIALMLQKAEIGVRKASRMVLLLNVSMLCLHVLFVGFLLLLTYQSINNKLEAMGSSASCYCTRLPTHSVELLHYSESLDPAYQCSCMTPQDETPMPLIVRDLHSITDKSLGLFNSNYQGEICTIYRDTPEDVQKAARMHVTEVKRLYGAIQVSILPLVLHFFAWAVFIKTMQEQDSISAEFIQDNILNITLYIFGEAIDIFSLLDDLDEHGRSLTMMRPLANGILGTFGAGLFVLYVMFPAEKVFSISAAGLDNANNKYIGTLFYSFLKLDWPLKLCTILVNISLLIVRAVLFYEFEGFSGMAMRSFFVLFMIREVYTILPKSAEVILEIYSSRKSLDEYQDVKRNEKTASVPV